MDKKVLIVTHDGMFHADDIFAVATLLFVLDTAPVVTTIVRTRDEDLIHKADFVVDVGAVYDSEKNRFDHHQVGGAGQRADGIPYASFGLVWKKFGKNIAGSEGVASVVDQNLVASIDADDNGVETYKKILADTGPYIIGNYFHNIRPTWQEGTEMLDERFLEAVGVARQVLKREVAHSKALVEAENLVRKAYDASSDKRLIVLDAFYPYEKTLATFSEPLFVVFPRLDGSWNVKTIRDDTVSFKNRKDLPEAWAGKHDAELVKVTGVPDAIFCHNSRFVAVAKSKKGAIKLAELALK
ncbi:MAG: MYG1 family protein [bacterium]|nr:MYG1 family protein [bacterium]